MIPRLVHSGLIGVMMLCCDVSSMHAQEGPSELYVDEQGDAVIRRTDSGNDAALPVGYEPIDLLSVEVGGWDPDFPASDLYAGEFESDHPDFVRIDVRFAGVASPPGPIGLNGFEYAPYRFGSRPVFGFIEFDIDHENESGGELMPIAQQRYLSNVARFSKSPRGSINERIAISHEDLDSSFYSEPWVERSGAELSVSMCGCFEPMIVAQDGNGNSIFDAGETWLVEGRFFERFQAFQPESALFGGSAFGLFDPLVQIRFSHDPIDNTTQMSLVYPLTNEGAALAAGEPVQPLDLSLLNHTSIEEAVDDLIVGADFTSGPLRLLTQGWRNGDLGDIQDPNEWGVTALIGTAPTIKEPSSLYIWTDSGFDELSADYNLDGINDVEDEFELADFIDDTDGGGLDSDLTVNGIITLSDPGIEFHLFDLNADGLISADDSPIASCPADLSGDGFLDFFDISAFLGSFQAQDPIADFDENGSFDFFDISAFLGAFSAGCP